MAAHPFGIRHRFWLACSFRLWIKIYCTKTKSKVPGFKTSNRRLEIVENLAIDSRRRLNHRSFAVPMNIFSYWEALRILLLKRHLQNRNNAVLETPRHRQPRAYVMCGIKNLFKPKTLGLFAIFWVFLSAFIPTHCMGTSAQSRLGPRPHNIPLASSKLVLLITVLSLAPSILVMVDVFYAYCCRPIFSTNRLRHVTNATKRHFD